MTAFPELTRSDPFQGPYHSNDRNNHMPDEPPIGFIETAK